MPTKPTYHRLYCHSTERSFPPCQSQDCITSRWCRRTLSGQSIFTRKVLGLRFVKKTVNFDDPGSYHLYFGDETGKPGTAITFFEWADDPAQGWWCKGIPESAGRITSR